MSKHTPGPWVYLPPEPEIGDEGTETGGFEYPGGIEGDDGMPVCEFGHNRGSGDMFENVADHRLIAAAPDMLAELRRLYEIHGYQSTFDLIAKATGAA